MENYNVDYFLRKFEAIPSSLWCSHSHKVDNKNCAMGFCHPYYSVVGAKNGEYEAVQELFGSLIVEIVSESSGNSYRIGNIITKNTIRCQLPAINNGNTKEYQQATEKERVLAALTDIKYQEEEDRAIEIVNNIIKEEKLELV